jgi:fructose-1,6-bisphosphatase/inositol monophosphatase family enzyme
MPITAPFSRAQRTTLFNLVRRAAQAEIMPRFRKLDSAQISAKTGPMDLVTDADTAAEAMITRGLQIAFPNAVIVGEEAAETDSDYRARLSEAELGFLIDPVDGTWNFAHGLPLFGTMVAACRFGRPVFGMIFDPVGRDVVWADIENSASWAPTSGASRAVSTRKVSAMDDMMGYVELAFMPKDHRQFAAQQCLSLRHATTLRCSAHQYRLLAQGAVDFNLATKLAPWDHAAGVMLCQQAGGHAAMLDGTPYNTAIDSGYLLCAGSESTWTQLATHFKGLLDA